MVFQLVAATAILCTATAFASTTCDARQMGARADGATKDTAAIQKAIDTCASKGGGIVILQGGTFLSGPLDLKSHVALSVAKDTLLKASEEVDDFPIREDAKWRRMALIHADQAEDIAITGEGTIDVHRHWRRQRRHQERTG
ncbi:glycosyl hydrolase family 28-related protein [Terriglobus sp. YAF25]|uniref:glycosyl hydrolase family 28-related protein n=1 Tax=Terriglobus sp. YAF25 TaxID=3233080 RepID=UPI003F978ADB